MSPKKASPTFREISLSLIDEPPRPVRESFDEVKLEELASSIAAQGVLEPLLVAGRGERFEILAGHRRYLASIMAKRSTVPCIVHDGATAKAEAIKVHENLYREDLNAGEEASYYSRLLEEVCGGDVDALAGMVGQKRNYVEERLILLRGDPDVLAELKAKRISFAVARELNKVSDDGFRRMYLEAAVRGGASARMVSEWRAKSGALIAALPAADGDGAGEASPAAVRSHVSGLVCFLCEDDADPSTLELLYVHTGCRKIVLNRLLAKYRETGGPE